MKKNSKFLVFVDHYAEYSKFDRYFTLEGTNIVEAMKDFNSKFNTYELHDRVYLYKLMQRKGRQTNHYEDVLVNRGHGWNVEEAPIEETVPEYRIYNGYSV